MRTSTLLGRALVGCGWIKLRRKGGFREQPRYTPRLRPQAALNTDLRQFFADFRSFSTQLIHASKQFLDAVDVRRSHSALHGCNGYSRMGRVGDLPQPLIASGIRRAAHREQNKPGSMALNGAADLRSGRCEADVLSRLSAALRLTG